MVPSALRWREDDGPWRIVPIPFSNPTIQTGIGLAVGYGTAYFYEEAWGSDFDYQTVELGYNRYFGIGTYRDHNMVTLQAEYRMILSSRRSLVGFAGVGWIAPELDDWDLDDVLPGFGLGGRYRVSKSRQTDLRVDLAVGRDEDVAFYLGIGQRF